MKRRLSFRSTRLVSAFLFCAVLSLAYFPIAKILAASAAPVVTVSGASRPFVNAQSARYLKPSYTGKADAVAALQAGARAVALTSADLDADGAPDLVAGYITANGGVITVTRGNPDAFAPKDPSLYGKALQGKVPAAFLNKAAVFAVPESPDFLATADFDGDGNQDLLAGKRGGGLYFLAGDGHGNLAAPKQVELPGDVSALAVNGAGHVAVGIESGSNAQLLVFDPRSSSGFFQPVATHSLSAPATSMEWGPLGINTSDLAVAAGNSVVVFYSALDSGAQSETIDLTFHVQALTIGDFTWDRDGRMEIAALGEDGVIHILQHGKLDTRPLTAADIHGRRARAMELLRKPPQDATSLGAWAEAKQIAGATSSTAGAAPQAMLQVSRLVPASTYGLIVLDGAQKQINMLNSSTGAGAQAMTISGTPVAAQALPAMLNGSRSLAVLTSSQVAPMLVHSLADPTFNVSWTNDEDDSNACNNSAITSGTGGDGNLSLREAVCEANNNGAATSVINVPSGTFDLTSLETGEIQIGTTSGANISIIGAGSNITIIQQTDGHDRIFEQDQAFVGGIPVAISNLTIRGGNCTGNLGIDCGFGGGGMLGTGNTGDDLTLTNVVFDHNTSGALDVGGGLNGSNAGSITISSCTFSNNAATQSIGGALDFSPGASSGNLSITNSTFTNNTATTSAPPAAGGALLVFPNTGNSAIISGSTFTGNTAQGSGSTGGAISANLGVTVSNSRIVGNSASLGSGFYESGGSGNTAIITNNWWGCNAGPNNTGCDHVDVSAGSAATFNPWLVLSASASPTQILPSGTSNVTFDLDHNSSGGSVGLIPWLVAESYGGTLGTTTGHPTMLNGVEFATYTAGSVAGHGSSSDTVDNQTVSAPIEILDTVNFNTSPAGLSYTVDSVSYTSPQTFNWVVGSSHPVSTTSPQAASPGSQYVWDNWTDSGPISHSITALSPTTNYIANFHLQYQLTTQASPAPDGSVTPASGGYYDPAASIPVTATPNGGFQFNNWSSTGGTFDSSTALSTNFHMPAAAATVTGSFAPIIVAAATTTTASSNNNPSFTAAPGNVVTFTATVTSSGTVNEGTVTFTDGINSLTCSGGNPAPVASGQAQCTTSFTAEGNHVITATYNGTVNFLTSNGTVSQEVDNHTVVTGSQYCNPGAISIPNTAGVATPYPSKIFVTGAGSTVSKVTLSLNQISTNDIPLTDLLLVGPSGAELVPFANVGDNSAIAGVNITLDDAAASLLPGGSPLTSGTFKPTSMTGSTSLVFPAPAPVVGAADYAATDGSATLASKFNSTAPNGTWELFAMANSANGVASIGGGWCLNITTSDFSISASPNSLSIAQGSSGSSSISTAVTAGAAGTIALSVSGVPAGASASLNPPSVTAGSSSTLSVNAGTAAPGPYTLTVTGTEGSQTHSVTVSVTVTPAPTTTALTSNPNPSAFGQSVTFTATVSSTSTVNAGTVAFFDGATSLGSGTVTGGIATIAYATLAVGPHSITAVYSGSANFQGSTSSPLTQTVNKAATTTTLVSSRNPSEPGKVVIFTATVTSAGTPTGQVQFLKGTKVLATEPLTGGVATYSTASLSPGTYTITAVYLGDSSNNGSTSAPVNQVVLATTKTTFTSPANLSSWAYGQPVTFTAQVTSKNGTIPNGETVLFEQGNIVLGTGTLTGGTASFTTSALTVGSNKKITAVYGGDAIFVGSTGAVTITVNKATTTTTLTSSVNPSNFKQVVIFTVTVAPQFIGTPTGTVTIKDLTTSTTLGTWSLSGGTVSVSNSKLSSGTHNLTATYNGNGSFAVSSASLTQTVH